MLLNVTYLVGFLASSVAGAAIGNAVPRSAIEQASAGEAITLTPGMRNNTSPSHRGPGLAGQVKVAEGHWAWGGGADQCDATGTSSPVDDKAEYEDCRYMYNFFRERPGFYASYDWHSPEKTALVIYNTCTVSAMLLESSKDLVRVGGENIADLLGYIMSEFRSGDYVGGQGTMNCFAMPSDSPANIQWTVHMTNAPPYDNSMVIHTDTLIVPAGLDFGTH
ncbi:hypothetical protein F4780DRAFT_780348 [Xylariomycetidae sp. FL0641]|nr:hypothetical protein F4780DRAFT_780348 [Xylariomycetidae sp. FL0641]